MTPHRLRVAQIFCRPLPPPLALRLGDRLYPHALGERHAHPFAVRTRSGSIFNGSTDDYHAVTIAVHGYSGEWRNWVIASTLCSRGDTILELGANVGTDTVAYSDVVGSAGHLAAFEPLPANLEQLAGVAKAQGNVRVFPCALSDEVGEIRFWRPPKGQNAGMARILTQDENLDAIKVDCVTLDSMEDRVGSARLIAMDVEGAEVGVLRGAATYLARHTPAIITEASRKHLTRQGESFDTLLATLRSHDYHCFRVTRAGLLAISRVDDVPEQSNWLAVHGSDLNKLARLRRCLRRAALAPCLPLLSPLYAPRG